MKHLSFRGVILSLLGLSLKAENASLQNEQVLQPITLSSPYSILFGKMFANNAHVPGTAYQKQYQMSEKEITANILDGTTLKVENKTALLVQNKSSTNPSNFSSTTVLDQLNTLKNIGANVLNSLYKLNEELTQKNLQLMKQQESIMCCVNKECTTQYNSIKCDNQTLVHKTFQKNSIAPKSSINELNDLAASPTDTSINVVKLNPYIVEKADISTENTTTSKIEGPVVDLPDDEKEVVRKEVLLATNNYREQHQCDDLSIDKEINQYAQEWSDHLTVSNTFQHREQPRKYGENLFKVFSNYSINIGAEAVKSWYDEILLDGGYNFNGDEKEMSKQSSLHFTQLIWRNTKTMGVGVSKSKDGWYNIVVNYWPPGNVIGMFKENVLPQTEKNN